MASKPYTVDLNKPLVFQVGHLGEAYNQWVHQPIVSKEGPRFFGNDFMEMLTRTVWWVIPLVWLPVICWLASVSLSRGLTPSDVASCLAGGVFIWTLLEYTLHRFLFHMETRSYWYFFISLCLSLSLTTMNGEFKDIDDVTTCFRGNTLHYLLHGCHHKHPMDGLRLVFPPVATAILSVPLWIVIRLTSTPAVAPTLFGGGLLGYVMYDVTHYYLHHGKPTSGLSQNMKRYHLNHHFRVQSQGFGITSPLWDRAFGTYPTTKTIQKNK